MGVYPNSWMVYVMETPTKIWMMTGDTPTLGISNFMCKYIYVMFMYLPIDGYTYLGI